jgi:hypothetical protein
MPLGFTVEALAGTARGVGALRMGLARLDGAEWLFPTFDPAARAAVFAAHPDSVTVLPGAKAAAAAREAAIMVAGVGDLGAAAAAVWEDLCVLQADAAGIYRLTAAAVGFPTDWHVADKMGQGLTAIHAPIHGYAEQLAAGVDHFFAQLSFEQIFGRSNWFVVENAAPRYLPTTDPATRFAHVSADNAGDTLFLRCERQTLRRLPDTGAVLFTIGIAVEPFARLSAGLASRIADSVAALGSGEHARRAAPHYAAALAQYAARRAEMEIAA